MRDPIIPDSVVLACIIVAAVVAVAVSTEAVSIIRAFVLGALAPIVQPYLYLLAHLAPV